MTYICTMNLNKHKLDQHELEQHELEQTWKYSIRQKDASIKSVPIPELQQL